MTDSIIQTHPAYSELVKVVEKNLERHPLPPNQYPIDFQAVLDAAEELGGVRVDIPKNGEELSLKIGIVIVDRMAKNDYRISLALLPQEPQIVQKQLCADLTIDFINHYPFAI